MNSLRKFLFGLFGVLYLMVGSVFAQSSLPLVAGKVLVDRIDLASAKKVRLPEGRWVVMGLHTRETPLTGGGRTSETVQHLSLMNEDEKAPIQYLSMSWTLSADVNWTAQPCDILNDVKNRPFKDTLGTNTSSLIVKCSAASFNINFGNLNSSISLDSAVPLRKSLWLPIAQHPRLKPLSAIDLYGYISKHRNDFVQWYAYINPKLYGLDQASDTQYSTPVGNRQNTANNLLKYAMAWNKQYLKEVEKDFFPGLFQSASGTIDKFMFSERVEPLALAASGQISAPPIVQPAATSSPPINAERDRVTAEIEAERKKRQELEQQIALSKERDRITAELDDERKKRQDIQAELDRVKELAESRLTERPRPQAAQRAERRVALVIGNAQYKSSPLENSVNDATDIDQALKRFGFQTTFLRNASLGQMREATRRFADQLTSADVALIYFAGHGIESKNKNYMIPVNADLKFEYELADQAYDAAAWLEMLEMIKSNNAERVNIVILDACRMS